MPKRARQAHKIPTDSYKHSQQFKMYKTDNETTDQDGFETFLFKLSSLWHIHTI